MMKYETDTRKRVFQYMCECAYRDRYSMWDGLSEDEPYRKEVEAEMRDFKKLSKCKIV